MKRPGKPRVVLVATAVLLGIFLVWRGMVTQREAASLAATGISFRATTFGTNHVHYTGNTFQRAVARVLGTRVGARVGAKRLVLQPPPFTPANETVGIWLTARSNESLVVRLLDDQGHEQPGIMSDAASSPPRFVSGHLFASFPRRQRELKVRVYGVTNGVHEKRGEFEVPNPVYGRQDYPVWPAESLPIMRQTNYHTFVLTRFDAGLQATGTLTWGRSTWTEVELIHHTDGVPTGPWRPLVVTFSDASGNVVHRSEPYQQIFYSFGSNNKGIIGSDAAAGTTVIDFPGMPWSDESAWRLRVDLIRTHRSRFHPRELWEIRDVPLPQPNHSTILNLQTNLSGTHVLLTEFSRTETEVQMVGANPIPVLHAVVTGPLVLDLVSITDQRGTNLPFAGPSVLRSSAVSFRLRPVTRASESVNFRFALHHPVSLEFMAKPRVVSKHVNEAVYPSLQRSDGKGSDSH